MIIGVELRSFLELVEHATSLAIEKGLTIYDAAYAALAEVEKAKLVTRHKELLGKLMYAVVTSELF
ncbi:MAG: hypothetical protein QXY49_03100 [Thermofilaceae archaeon]